MSQNVDLVRQSTDIVQIISEVVPLKKSGANHFGCCPFHHEKTPSFSVSASRQMFHCFGCKVGGDVFHFVQQYYHWDFPQALEELARRANITLEVTRSDPLWDEGLGILKLVQEKFTEGLHSKAGERFQAYLKNRNIPEKLWESFSLGAHLGDSQWMASHIKKSGLNMEIAVQLGVLGKSHKGDYIDRFMGRLMFPILDEKGRPRGFGGRSLGDDQPKYINSPKTSVFDKSRLFYGMHLAHSQVSKRGFVVLVEGYLDVMALHEFGMGNAMGSMGTALAIDQIRVLKRWTQRVISLYDADQAGLAATEKHLGSFLKEGLEAKVVVLPEAKDPDAFLHDETTDVQTRKAALKTAFENSTPALDYLIQNSVLSSKDAMTRGKRLRALVSILDAVPDELQRTLLKKDVAKRFELPENLLFASSPEESAPVVPQEGPKLAKEEGRWEGEILRFTVLYGTKLELDLGEALPYLLSTSKWGEILARLVDLGFTSKTVADLQWLDEVDPEVRVPLREWALEARTEMDETDLRSLWKDLVKRLKMSFFQREKYRIQNELTNAEQARDPDRVRRCLTEKQDLVRWMKSDGVPA